MQVLLSILLYLSVIVSPGTYYDIEIDAIAQQNESEISAIQADADLTQQIVQDYQDDVSMILIIDWETEK